MSGELNGAPDGAEQFQASTAILDNEAPAAVETEDPKQWVSELLGKADAIREKDLSASELKRQTDRLRAKTGNETDELNDTQKKLAIDHKAVLLIKRELRKDPNRVSEVLEMFGNDQVPVSNSSDMLRTLSLAQLESYERKMRSEAKKAALAAVTGDDTIADGEPTQFDSDDTVDDSTESENVSPAIAGYTVDGGDSTVHEIDSSKIIDPITEAGGVTADGVSGLDASEGDIRRTRILTESKPLGRRGMFRGVTEVATPDEDAYSPKVKEEAEKLNKKHNRRGLAIAGGILIGIAGLVGLNRANNQDTNVQPDLGPSNSRIMADVGEAAAADVPDYIMGDRTAPTPETRGITMPEAPDSLPIPEQPGADEARALAESQQNETTTPEITMPEAPDSLPIPEQPGADEARALADSQQNELITPATTMPEAPDSLPIPEQPGADEARAALEVNQELDTLAKMGTRITTAPGASYSQAIIDISGGSIDAQGVQDTILKNAEKLVTLTELNLDAIITSQAQMKGITVEKDTLRARNDQILDSSNPEQQAAAMAAAIEDLNNLDVNVEITVATPQQMDSTITPAIVDAYRDHNYEKLDKIDDAVGTGGAEGVVTSAGATDSDAGSTTGPDVASTGEGSNGSPDGGAAEAATAAEEQTFAQRLMGAFKRRG